MPKKSKQRKTSSRQSKTPMGMALYHDMAVYENFERCAHRLFKIVQMAEYSNPGKPRFLYIDIQGHKNEAGGFDHDSWEIIGHFILEYLSPYLSRISTPLHEMRNTRTQINDIPEALAIAYPEGESGFWYDDNLLAVRAREQSLPDRKTPPSKEAIEKYLGMSGGGCLICWGTPAERAHAVPTALGGSMDVRNFALLCQEHHRQAPDIADAEAFWAWIDYAERRDAGSKWEDAPEEIKEWIRVLGSRTERLDRSDTEFIAGIKFELRHLYGWEDRDFSESSWSLQEEYHRVLDAATRKHFGVEKKVATHAWAYDVAMRRLAPRSGKQRARKVLLFDEFE
jgi:hypothetical protein